MMEKSKLVKVEKVKKKRIWEIDFLRGLSIFLMIIDHAFIALSEFGDAWFTAGQMRVSAEIQAYGLIEMIKAMSSGELLGGASFALRLCYFPNGGGSTAASERWLNRFSRRFLSLYAA